MSFPLKILGIIKTKVVAPPVPELHWWPFSGNANDAVGAINGVVSGATLTTDKGGNPNEAYSFNSGANDYISASSQGNIGTVYTITARMKPIADFSFAWINATAFNYYCFFNSSSNFIHNVNGNNVQFTISPQLNVNNYYDFAITRNGTAVSFYVDAVQQDVTKNLAANDPFIFDYLTRNGSFSYDGIFDDMRIYNRVLSIAELQELNTI